MGLAISRPLPIALSLALARMLGLFVSSVNSLKQWAWNNVALLAITGLAYDLSLTALDRIDTFKDRHNALSRRVTSDMAYFEQKLNSLNYSLAVVASQSKGLRPGQASQQGQAVDDNAEDDGPY